MVKKILKWLAASLALLLVSALGAGLYYGRRANDAMNNINREPLLPTATVKTPDPAAPQSPMNFLLLGSDSRGEDDHGRSDSIMLAHLPADRANLYLISLPRDLYVEIPGKAKNKINAAYAMGGAPLTAETINNLMGITIDHVAIIDFNGFIDLVDLLGGVTINNPHEGCDTSPGQATRRCWDKGTIDLTRKEALWYVRWRHGLPNGDIDRAANQQRVLKAIISKTLSRDTLTNPNTLISTIEKVGTLMTVDDSLTPGAITSLAMGLRFTSGEAVRTLTVPIKGFDMKTVGSVDLLDEERFGALAEALRSDELGAYWEANKNSPVITGDPGSAPTTVDTDGSDGTERTSRAGRSTP